MNALNVRRIVMNEMNVRRIDDNNDGGEMGDHALELGSPSLENISLSRKVFLLEELVPKILLTKECSGCTLVMRYLHGVAG